MKLLSMLMAACLMVSSNAASLRRTKEEDDERKILAKLELSEDVSVTFLRDGPGVIVTAEANDEGAKLLEEKLAGLEEEDDDKRSLVDTWKALTDKDVPKGLEEEDKRMRMSPVEPLGPGDEALDDESEPGKANGMAKMSCNQFEANECFHTNKSVCWSCRTGSGHLSRRTSYMYSKVHVYRGRITQKLEVKDCSNCSWRTVQNKSVKKGWTWWQWARNYYAVNAKVTNANGDGYHWTIKWT